jgi:aspartyl-tRNA(Asn)/glutamyl-tRNA(Gln) amidotransferase subunit C
MPLSEQEVRHVANLARLELSDDEIEQYRDQLSSMLDRFAELQNIDVAGVDPKPHAVDIVNVMDEDEARPPLPRERALENGSDTRAGLFIVPTIIEE